MWRPNREGGGNRTPFGCECGVQNGGKLWNGRQVRLKVASRIVESCGMDAIEKRERRPKSQILTNRTPGGRECGVQNCGELGNGRQVRLEVASRMVESCGMDARGKRRWRPNPQSSKYRTPPGGASGVQLFCNQKNRRHREI